MSVCLSAALVNYDDTARRKVKMRAHDRIGRCLDCLTALEVDNFMRYINLLTYLLTYCMWKPIRIV